MTDRQDFNAYIESLGLQYFAASEFLVRTDTPPNSIPPSDLWPNIKRTAEIIDKLRGELGRPIRITSCYRNPTYNKKVGGGARSRHLAFNACDIVSDAGAQAMYDVLIRWRREGLFKGGLGLYPNRFVHIDTRGYNATWRG